MDRIKDHREMSCAKSEVIDLNGVRLALLHPESPAQQRDAIRSQQCSENHLPCLARIDPLVTFFSPEEFAGAPLAPLLASRSTEVDDDN
jgi:hypothetical protein